jgi:large subunit ribosomal protein L13
MKTYSAKKGEIQHKWYVVDAEGKVLGRLATEIAKRLRGKHKPVFTHHVDTGDFVIVVNASKVALTGRKPQNKVYTWHTEHPGGLKSTTAERLLQTRPERLIQNAVQGMLPKNRLSKKVLRKLKIYAGPEHPHQAQQPEPLKI